MLIFLKNLEGEIPLFSLFFDFQETFYEKGFLGGLSLLYMEKLFKKK